MGILFPQNGWWWLALPLLVLLALRAHVVHRQSVRAWFSRIQIEGYAPTWVLGLRVWAVFLLMLALLGPYVLVKQDQDPNQVGRQIYHVLDVSGSMTGTDLKPNRLEWSKALVARVVRSFPADAHALLVYAEAAYLFCPPTTDPNVFLTLLEQVHPNLFAQQGSDLRTALALFSRQLDSVPVQGQQARLGILYSDGEHSGPGFTSILNRLRKQQAHLVAVGAATPQGTVLQREGRTLTDARGLPVVSVLQEQRLNDLAKAFGGQVLMPDRASDALLSAVQRAPFVQWAGAKTYSPANQYGLLVAIALASLLASVLVRPKTRLSN